MIIKSLQVGQIGTNCYIFGDEKAGVCAIVDPGDEAERIAKAVGETGLTPRYILLTHGHFDHVLAVGPLHARYPDAEIYIHKGEVNWAKIPQNYMQMTPVEGMHTYDEGDALTLGSLTITVMRTPGHSPGSVVLKVADCLFAGDTLFAGSCGRTDFAGGSYGQMRSSLKRLVELPGDYRVFPGHEGPTTLDRERKSNYFVREALGK